MQCLSCDGSRVGTISPLHLESVLFLVNDHGSESQVGESRCVTMCCPECLERRSVVYDSSPVQRQPAFTWINPQPLQCTRGSGPCGWNRSSTHRPPIAVPLRSCGGAIRKGNRGSFLTVSSPRTAKSNPRRVQKGERRVEN